MTMQTGGNAVVFNRLVVHGNTLAGECSAWSSFISQLSTKTIISKATSISMVSMTSLQQSIRSRNATVTCVRTAVVSRILDQLVMDRPSSTVPDSNQCFDQEEVRNSWSVNFCGNYPTLLVNRIIDWDAVWIKPCQTDGCSLANSPRTSMATGLSFLQVLAVAFEHPILPPRILSLKAIAFKRSISVAVTLAAEAQVFCAALLHQPTSVSDIVLNGVMEWTSANTTSIQLHSLVPATTYHITCAAVSSDGIQSDLRDVLNVFTVVRTLCCKQISASLSFASILVNQLQSGAVRLSLDNLPTDAISITISATTVTPNLRYPSNSFSPSVISFFKNTSTNTASLLFTVKLGYSISALLCLAHPLRNSTSCSHKGTRLLS